MHFFFRYSLLWLLLTGLVVGISGCVSSPLTEEFDNIQTYYQTHDKPKQQWDNFDRVKLRFIENGTADKPAVVFIHGTPGGREFFSSYINHPQLQQKARLLSIDRPGWGRSVITGPFEPTLTDQSKMLGQWLCKVSKSSPSGKVIIVGHSYGATLSPRLALDHPQCISAMVLLAGAADPDLAAPRWYNTLAQFSVIGWLIDFVDDGLSQANTEMMPIQAELEKIRGSWHKITQPIVAIYGDEDRLVDADHAIFLKRKLSHSPAKVIRLPDQGHFVLFSHKQLVVDEILKLLPK